MVESDWGDWLPRAIESADPDGVALWYLGCNGFVLKAADGTTVMIDPYVGTGDPPRTIRMVPIPFDPNDVGHVDAVLATHEHTDHVHGESAGPIMADSGATLYGPDDSLAVAREAENWTEHYDIDADQFAEVTEGDTVEIGPFTVHVEPANDPDATHPVSYVFEHEAGTFFHGGDARPGEFEQVGETYDIDLGVVAFGSTGMLPPTQAHESTYTEWYNGETDLVEATQSLQLETLVPTHWDMWKGMTADPTVLHRHLNSFEYPHELTIVEIGDRLDL